MGRYDMKRTSSQGFTLIELVIVIGIISVLAAVASYGYQRYIAKTKVMEVVRYAHVHKREIQEYFYSMGEFPDNYHIPRIDPDFMLWASVLKPSSNPNKVTILIALDKNQIPGSVEDPHFQLQGIIQSDGTVEWSCGMRDWWRKIIPTEFLPETCQDRNSTPWD